MSPEQKAAFINSQAACAMATIASMVAHDRAVAAAGEHGFYTEEAYLAVPNQFGIGHNTVVGFFHE